MNGMVICSRCGERNFGTGNTCLNCNAPLPKPSVPTLVWFSSVGAEKGTPWRVRHHDGTESLFAAVRIEGIVEFRDRPDGELTDGPRAVAVLVDGTLMAGR